jgi:hypothetical protein
MDNNLIYLDNKVTGSTGYLTYFSGSAPTSSAVGQSLLFQTGSQILMTGSFKVLGAVSASYFVGDGSGITNLPSTNSIPAFIATGSATASVDVDNTKIFSIYYNSINCGIINADLGNASYGDTTLKINTTGIQNTAFGAGTLHSNTTGESNTAIGNASLIQNTTGKHNTAIGASSSPDNTIGDYNTNVGYASLFSNSSGNNNVAIGVSAGQSNVSGDGNVFIGYAAGVDETGSDKLYIANSGTSTPLIKGNFSSGVVTINNVLQITPQNPLPLAASYPYSFAVSSSGVPYFSNGTTWTALF